LFPETFSAHPENPIARETKSAIKAIWRFFRVVTQTSFFADGDSAYTRLSPVTVSTQLTFDHVLASGFLLADFSG